MPRMWIHGKYIILCILYTVNIIWFRYVNTIWLLNVKEPLSKLPFYGHI